MPWSVLTSSVICRFVRMTREPCPSQWTLNMRSSSCWQDSTATDFFAGVRLIPASDRGTMSAMPPRPARHVVAVLAMDGVHPFEMSVPCEVFGIDRPEVVHPWPYELIVTSIEASRTVRTANGFDIVTPYGLEDL